MVDDLTTEKALSQDSYDSIAFKDRSAQYLAEIIDDITQLSRGGAIYPPEFATWRDPELEYGVSLQQHNKDDGRLSPAEAVAIKVMADEGSAIAQSLFESTAKTRLISEIVSDPNGRPSDVVGGIADFGYSLCETIRIREKMVEEETIPIGSTNRDDTDRLLWQRYQDVLKLDGMTIKGNTVAVAAKSANEYVEQRIRGVPEGAENEKDLQDRMKSRRRGIELGAKVYMQVLNVAIQRGLPATLERAVDAKVVTPHQVPKVSK